MANTADSPEDLDRSIERTRQDYLRQREALEDELARSYADAGGVTDRLLSSCDEYGREHALQLMADRPDDYGDWRANSGAGWRGTVADLTEKLDRLAEVHERLDDLTVERERLRGRGDGQTRHLHIQGEEFVVDGATQELTRVQTGERIRIEETAAKPDKSLAQRLAEKAPANQLQTRTRPDRDRDRSR